MYKSGDGDGSQAMYTVRLFLFFDLRGDATGKLAGIGKNVNDDKSEDDDGSRAVFDDVDCFRSQG